MKTKIKDKDWKCETRVVIKNQCASCGSLFKNNARRFQDNGNYCSTCSERISLKMEWYKLEGRNLKREQQRRFALVDSILLKRYQLNMRFEKKEHDKFLEKVGRVRV